MQKLELASAASADLSVPKSASRLIVGIGIVALVLVVAVLAGIGQYAGAKHQLVADADTAAARFDTIFHEASASRLQSLRLGAEILARDQRVGAALSRHDRAELAVYAVPFYNEVLKPRFNISVLDFQTTDGVMLLRAHNPSSFGDDASKRKTVMTALKDRSPIAGLEIGRSGPELRAMTPVLYADSLAGSLELGSGLSEPLQAAGRGSGLDYGFGVDEKISESFDRPFREDNDVRIGPAIYTTFSNDHVRELLHHASPPDRRSGSLLTEAGGQETYLQTFPIEDVNHAAVARVTVVKDLKSDLVAARNTILIRTALAAIAVLGGLLFAMTQFSRVRESLAKSFAGRLQDLHAKAAAYDRLNESVDDLQTWKRSFVSEMVSALGHPLEAIRGALEAATHDVGSKDAARREAVQGQLASAKTVLSRLLALVSEQADVVAIREGWRPVQITTVDLVEVGRDVLARADEEFAPNTIEGDTDNAKVSADPVLLRDALQGLIQEMRRTGHSSLKLKLRKGADQVEGELTTATAWSGGAPKLDGAEALMRTLTTGEANLQLTAAHAVMERMGGGLSILGPESGKVGFSFSLPRAVG